MNTYETLADVVVILHLGYVLFVILGLLAILLGYMLQWRWVRNAWFRFTHLTMITIVAVEALLSITCPLTTLEHRLRARGGAATAGGSFIGTLAHELLFLELPHQLFTAAYCTFCAAVLTTFWLIPPKVSLLSKRDAT